RSQPPAKVIRFVQSFDVPARGRWCSYFNGPFPLTPALSLGERGHRWQRYDMLSEAIVITRRVQFAIFMARRLGRETFVLGQRVPPHPGPLPWGEGGLGGSPYAA